MIRILGPKKFNGMIGAIIAINLLVSILLVKFVSKYFMTWGALALLLVYAVIAYIGYNMSKDTNEAKPTIIGYSLVMATGGVILNRFFPGITPHLLSMALGVTVVMAIVSYAVPTIFEQSKSIGTLAALTFVALEIISKQAGWSQAKSMPVVMAAVFCAYIAYNWIKAQEYEYSDSAAADAAAELYLRPVGAIQRLAHEYLGKRE